MPANSARPGCYLCYTEPHTGVQMIDTGQSIDMEGRLIICARCIEAMGDLLGYIPPDKAEKLRDKNQELGSQVSALSRKIVHLKDAQEAILEAAKVLSE